MSKNCCFHKRSIWFIVLLFLFGVTLFSCSDETVKVHNESMSHLKVLSTA
jgi:hypothetical protein